MPATLSPRLETLVRIARAAAEVVMRHYEAGCDAREKSDRSPVPCQRIVSRSSQVSSHLSRLTAMAVVAMNTTEMVTALGFATASANSFASTSSMPTW